MAPPKIPKSVFNSIQKKVEQEASQPPKEKKPKKEKKKVRSKEFDAKIDDMAEYERIMAHFESTIGLLTQAPISSLCNKLCYTDRVTTQPCLYYCLSIPHFRVGEKRAKSTAPTTDDFYGTFASEISLFSFLIGICGLARTNPIVQHCREYYKISPKTLERKFSDAAITNFLETIKKSRAVPLGTLPIPHISQLGRGKKLYKAVWYYNTINVEIPDNLRWINTDRVVAEEGLLTNQAPELQAYRFNTYLDFTESEAAVQAHKAANSSSNKYWRDIIKEKGAEEAMKLYYAEFPEKEASQRTTGTKRKDAALSKLRNSDQKKKVQKVEDNQNLETTMKDIESKILRSSAINYYSDDDSTGEEEEEIQCSQPVFEELDLSSSSSEEEEEPVVLKKAEQPLRNSGNKPAPHVIVKPQPSSSSNKFPPATSHPIRTPTPPVRGTQMNTRNNRK